MVRILLLLISTLNLSAQLRTENYAGLVSGYVNGYRTDARFNNQSGLCIDKLGNIYITDTKNHRVRKINIDGNVTTIAGNGIAGFVDSTYEHSMFNEPWGICVDDNLNLYVADFQNQRIRKISNGRVSTIAGVGISGFKEGYKDSAMLSYPRGLCLDDSGNVYIADSWNHRIRKLSTNGLLSTFAGNPDLIGVQSLGALKDTSRMFAKFYTPTAVKFDNGNFYITDAYNHAVRKIDVQGNVTTLCGGKGLGPDGGGNEDGDVTISQLNTPTELCVHPDSNCLYISDLANNTIRKLDISTKILSTYAGNTVVGSADGLALESSFNRPRGIDTHKGVIYVNDPNNNRVRRIFNDKKSVMNKNILSDNFEIKGNKICVKETNVSIKLFSLIGIQMGSFIGNNFDIDLSNFLERAIILSISIDNTQTYYFINNTLSF
jgi:sugar lactone lactonase YvrE